jgi:hypothetical protein
LIAHEELNHNTGVVDFYSSKYPKAAYVIYQVVGVADADLPGVLQIFYPGQIIEGSNDLTFQEEVACDESEVSREVEFICQHLSGNSTCFPEEDGVCIGPLCIDLDLSKRSAEKHLLETATGLSCDLWTNKCKSQYQSQSGSCTGDYQYRYYDVPGYQFGVSSRTRKERK